jgi:F0F1-type ATP synthase delta subunit
MKRDKYDLTDAELELIEKVSKMLGKDYQTNNISRSQNGGIIVEVGKLNVDRFIRKAFELFPEEFNEEK